VGNALDKMFQRARRLKYYKGDMHIKRHRLEMLRNDDAQAE
jgi:hypothetical protein